MKKTRWSKWVMVVSLLTASIIHAEEGAVKDGNLPTIAAHANWVFSGVVNNENGESYGYFFQMQRDQDKFHAVTALFDAQSKKVLLFDDSSATLTNVDAYNWKVGDSFLRFNPINDSWVFGMKKSDKKGFNFKVDMLSQNDNKPAVQNLRSGVELMVGQTGHLNGHIRSVENQEQFVTAKNAWYRQVWLTENQENPHPFSGVLCRFNDGSGFYSVNLREADALRGAITGACNEQGSATPISQFIKVAEDKTGIWHIRVPSPYSHWVLMDSLKQNSVVSGLISQKEKFGFCVLSDDKLGEATA
jgi:hypothetical protein